jgi:hypothetical protein
MLVGETMSGKTTCYKVLHEAINHLRDMKSIYFYTRVDTYILNPKSVTIDQLYGFTDAGRTCSGYQQAKMIFRIELDRWNTFKFDERIS